MTTKDLFIIVGVMLIFVVIALFYLHVVDDVQEFRISTEGRCLKETAKKFCESEGMSFKKLYSRLYGDYEFSCESKRGNFKSFNFTSEELNKCNSDYYGR